MFKLPYLSVLIAYCVLMLELQIIYSSVQVAYLLCYTARMHIYTLV